MERPILRLTHFPGSQQVDVKLVLNRATETTCNVDFSFVYTNQDLESQRWYFEDFPYLADETSSKVAEHAVNRQKEIGQEIFNQVFSRSNESRKIWKKANSNLESLRVEIADENQNIPWEFICNTNSNQKPLPRSYTKH